MFFYCAKCGNPNERDLNFCRQCGAHLHNDLSIKNSAALAAQIDCKDPDELTGRGIGNVIVGDGFFMVALILSVTQSAVGGSFWLILLIPAFFFFGKGFADILHARQVKQRIKQKELKAAAPTAAELPPSVSFVSQFKKHISGELSPIPSVTERTTRDLS